MVKTPCFWASLVAQWLRICLPIQGTRVRALVWEDPTYHRASKPVCHNYWAYAVEPKSHNYWGRELKLLKPTCLEPMLYNKRSPYWLQLEKACMQQWRPDAAKNKKCILKNTLKNKNWLKKKKTPRFQQRGSRFDPWWGTNISHVAQCGQTI